MMKRILCCITGMLLALNLMCGSAFAEASKVRVILNGKELNITVTEVDGYYLLPFKELMYNAGVYAEYNNDREAYVAEINEYEAEVPVNSDRACYDEVWLELDTPTKELDGDVAVEIDYIDKIYGISVKSENGIIRINAEIEKKKSDDEKFDVQEYLSQITPKNTPWSEEDLFRAALSDSKLIAQREVEVNDAPGFTRALELENLTEPELYYRAQVTMPNNEAISAGDVIYATIYAKKISCVDESGLSKFDFCVEALDATWTKFLSSIDQVGDEWTKFTYVFSPTKDVKANGSQLGLRIGFRYQTIQFGGLSIVNYGKKADMSLIAPEKVVKTTYHGREDDALWREEAFRRIEKYRKNDMCIEVTDEVGNPISGAKIDANMTKSEFLWGNAVNESLCFTWDGVTPTYQRILKSEFNSITNESVMKPSSGESRGAIMGRVNPVNFARENNMHYRAHALFWDAVRYMPEGVIDENSSEEELTEFLKSFASRLLYSYGDTLEEIDVVNEPLNNHYYMDKYGTDFVAELFKTVKDIRPDIRCFINEIGIGGESTERLLALIDELRAKGAEVEGIGIQDHSYGMYYPQRMYNSIDEITENLKYVSITEYDFVSGLSDSVDALQCEADYLRDSIIMAYSHPKMTGFTMWGFGDFCHWRGNAPLYFSSYAPKPALKEWNKYVWGEWFTQEKAETGADGKAVIRGHRGDYDITVTVNGKSAKTQLQLTKDGENKVCAVVSSDGIKMTSSLEPKRPLPQIPVLNAVYNESNAKNEYKKLYANRAAGAVREDGSDASFLLKEDNESICALDKQTSVILKTDGTDKNGYVTLRTSKDTEGLFCIESRSGDGEWKRVYAGETSDGMVSVPIDSDTEEVKISGLTDARSLLRYACISQKEIRK
ncbi:MAG: endo-1,4-beta-xylanase [Monoglobaceae bacterium]